MQPLITHQGIIIPLNRANIDTDMLLPKQYLKSLEASGFGAFLFDELSDRAFDPAWTFSIAFVLIGSIALVVTLFRGGRETTAVEADPAPATVDTEATP